MNAATLLQSHRQKSIKMNGNDFLFVIKRIPIVISVLAVLAVGTAICVECETCVQADNLSIIGVYHTNSGFAVLSVVDGCYTICLVSHELETRYIDTGFNADECIYTYYNNRFVFSFAEQDENSNVLLLKIYDCAEDCFFKKMVTLENKSAYSGIAFDSEGRLYAADNGTVDIFDSSLTIEKKLEPACNIQDLVPDKDGSIIYCVTDKNVCIISGGELRELPVSACEVYPVNIGFSDERGNIYDNDGILLYSGFQCIHGCTIFGEYYLGIKNGMFTAVLENEERSVAPICDNTYFCVNNDLCLLAWQEDDTKFALYTLNEIEELFACSQTDVNTDNIQNDDTLMYDTPYVFDGCYIAGLPQGCTAAQFRSMYGYDYTFYTPEGSSITSGILGTGTRAVLNNSGEMYIIIVFGDVSGNGKAGEKDKTDMTKILLGSMYSGDEFLIACDINHDGIFDLTDLTAMELYLENRYTITQTY